jgi:hypothetical protein
MSGQSWKNPVAGRLRQALDPPPQFGIPESPTRAAPISRMTVPVTIGGNIRWRTLGGTKDMKISRKAQTRDVPVGSSDTHSATKARIIPRTYPYASGQGSLVTVPSAPVVEGHVPLEYRTLKIFEDVTACDSTRRRMPLTPLAVLRVAKLVPTTVNIPVPK